MGKTNPTRTLSKEAVAVLGSMEVEGSIARFDKYHQLGGSGQLDRKLYEECDKALKAIGGTWNRHKKGHLFGSNPREALDQVVLTGAFTDTKVEFQAFYTPADLADKIVEKCCIEPRHLLLEPSAGRGAIIDAVLRAVPNLSSFLLVEMMPANAAALRAKDFSVYEGDFLSWNPTKRPDRVAMNPPFSGSQDIRHVEHAYSMLAVGGRLVSVMSLGFTFRKDRLATSFKQLVEDHGEWERLPEGTFKASGTNIPAALVTLQG